MTKGTCAYCHRDTNAGWLIHYEPNEPQASAYIILHAWCVWKWEEEEEEIERKMIKEGVQVGH